jgi:superfamily II DNA or RNA helicase
MAEINTNRTEEQNSVAAALAIRGGIIDAATGFGKTRTLIKTVEIIRESFPHYRTVWAVPTEKLRDEDIPEDIRKWRAGDKFQCDTVCYKSLGDYSGGDILVLDEFHHITEINMAGYLKNPPKIILAASATSPTSDEKKAIIKHFGLKLIRKISLHEATEKQYVNEFEIHLCKVAIDKEKKYLQGFKHQGKVTEDQRNTDINALVGRIVREKGRAPMHILLMRKRALASFLTKEAIAKKVIKKWQDKRTLIFCSSIEQAERLCQDFYHSQTDDIALERFNKGKIQHLSCVQALDEGVNMTNVENVIIISPDAQIRRLLQRIGRGIRKAENQERCKVCLIVSTNTQEEVWVDNNLKELKLPEDKVKIYHYEQSNGTFIIKQNSSEINT